MLSKIIGRFGTRAIVSFNSLLENIRYGLEVHRRALQSDLCLPIYGQIAIFILFLFVYRSTNIPWQVIVVSLFIVLSYPLLAGLYGEGKGFLILIISLILGGIILHKYMTLLMTPVVIILLINFLIAAFRDSHHIKRLPAISGVLLLVFLGFTYYFRLESLYINPDDLYNLTLLKQVFDTDGSMHMAIVNMILNNGFPSTGLHLTPLLHYHCLGHYVAAVFCLVTGLSTFNLYYFIYGLFLFPLIIISIVVLIRQLYPAARWSYFFLSLILFCSFSLGSILGGLENPNQLSFRCTDPTTPVSIIFLLWIFRNIVKKDLWWTIPLLVALSFYAKSSTGTIMFCACLLVLTFSDQSAISKVKYFLITALLSAVAVHFTSDPAVASCIHFKFYSYYHDYILPVQGRSFLNALWVNCNVTIVSIVILILFLLKNLIHFKEIWICHKHLILFTIGIIIAGVSAGSFTFPDGSHCYFIELMAYPSLILGAISLEKIVFLRENKFIKLLAWGIILIFSLNAILITVERFKYYANFHISRHKNISGNVLHYYNIAPSLKTLRLDPSKPKYEEPSVIEPYFKALKYIYNNYSGRKYVVEIPDTETGFWNYTLYPYPRSWMPFYIPVISGKPAWNGYDYKIMKGKNCAWYAPGSYGYSSYFKKDDNIEYKDHGYEGKLVIQTGKDNHIELIENNCNGTTKKLTIE